ncbi:uncharacterized protein A4U43_C10F9650 [Asparagus officinalis]|uniref:Uncharacterized protein n=1 Tax=Asparagus officinalis TaxID=4686 RepID=A0A5P1E1N9_ASPOF|nr:uncharacterized protein A4U43_C10F9650 [Asparagus officinalis]
MRDEMLVRPRTASTLFRPLSSPPASRRWPDAWPQSDRSEAGEQLPDSPPAASRQSRRLQVKLAGESIEVALHLQLANGWRLSASDNGWASLDGFGEGGGDGLEELEAEGVLGEARVAREVGEARAGPARASRQRTFHRTDESGGRPGPFEGGWNEALGAGEGGRSPHPPSSAQALRPLLLTTVGNGYDLRRRRN